MSARTTGRIIAGPGARRRWTRGRLILVALLALLAGGSLVGWLYETYAVRRDARQFPPPGAFVDVGGRRLHYVCAGTGSPLVLFEVGGFNNSMSFRDARAALARQTRVCAYDRVGIGWSDPGPSRIPVSALAGDLRAVLDEVEPDRPIVLVASSIGGLTAEFFARQHPRRVVGLVLLDAGNSYSVARASQQNLAALARMVCGGVRAAGAVGLVRLFDPWNLRHERTDQSARSAALMYGSKPWVTLCAMVRAAESTLSEFVEVPPLPASLPVTALSAETREGFLPPAMASWVDLRDATAALRASHQRLAEGSTHGVWRIVPGSDHQIASSQPEAVVEAVMDIIRLKPDATAVSASGRKEGR